MSAWSTSADLREQVRKRWDKGELLAELVTPSTMFPLRLTLRTPSSSELSERFESVRAWVAELQLGARSGYRLVMRDVRHRIIGQNSVPDEAWVDSIDDALRFVGKGSEARTFGQLVSATQEQQPLLLPWLHRQPLRALGLATQWTHMLALVTWLVAHPRPGIYLREVDLAGIHSKFVEAQRSVLAELLDLVLPAEAIDSGASGISQFARRYGFRDKPLRVRFRLLDPATAGRSGTEGLVPGLVDHDHTVTQDDFARLAPSVDHVFITENEINFLAFPRAARSLVVFGSGYGFAQLAHAGWLATASLHYWGDIDTHGFAILDQLRAHHPHAKSLLMDRATLLAHEPQWTVEPQPAMHDLQRLTVEERALYDDLRWCRLRETRIRLEQERIGFGWATRAVAAIAGSLHGLRAATPDNDLVRFD